MVSERAKGILLWYGVPILAYTLFGFTSGWPYYSSGRALEVFIDSLLGATAFLFAFIFVIRAIYRFVRGYVDGYERGPPTIREQGQEEK